MKLVTEAGYAQKTKELTETKFQVDLDDNTSVYVSVWSEHEYQMEAIEQALINSMRFKSCEIMNLERIDDRYTVGYEN